MIRKIKTILNKESNSHTVYNTQFDGGYDAAESKQSPHCVEFGASKSTNGSPVNYIKRSKLNLLQGD